MIKRIVFDLDNNYDITDKVDRIGKLYDFLEEKEGM